MRVAPARKSYIGKTFGKEGGSSRQTESEDGVEEYFKLTKYTIKKT